MPAPPSQPDPAGAESDAVPETDAAATLRPALPLPEEAAGTRVGGFALGSVAGWCAFRGGPAPGGSRARWHVRGGWVGR